MMGQQPLTKCVTRPLAPTLATCQKENQCEAKNGLLLGTGQEGHSAHGNRRRINLLTEAVPSGGDATFRRRLVTPSARTRSAQELSDMLPARKSSAGGQLRRGGKMGAILDKLANEANHHRGRWAASCR